MQLVFITLALLPIVFAQNVQVANDDSAHCTESVPAFFATENAELATTTSVRVKGVSERQCITMCTDNRDLSGRPLVCASAAYEASTKVCQVYRVKSRPDGLLPIKFSIGKKYLEKFCLPTSAPFTCGEAQFARANQKVLVGFAKNVSVETTLAGCVRQCVEESFDCKSAAFFYEDGECITNRASAMDSPDTFLEEANDKVIYFENGCSETVQPLVIDNTAASVLNRVDIVDVVDPLPQQSTQEVVTTTTAPLQLTTTIPREYRHRVGYSQWSAWTSCDRPDGRRIRRRKCERASGECTMPLLHVQWCSEVNSLFTATTTTTTTQAPAVPVVQPRSEFADFDRAQFSEGVPGAPTMTRQMDIPSAPVVEDGVIPIEMRGWGEWSVECQAFVTEQPCENNEMIGFQTRSCEGNPFQCQGTFFRYCTLPC